MRLLSIMPLWASDANLMEPNSWCFGRSLQTPCSQHKITRERTTSVGKKQQLMTIELLYCAGPATNLHVEAKMGSAFRLPMHTKALIVQKYCLIFLPQVWVSIKVIPVLWRQLSLTGICGGSSTLRKSRKGPKTSIVSDHRIRSILGFRSCSTGMVQVRLAAGSLFLGSITLHFPLWVNATELEQTCFPPNVSVKETGLVKYWHLTLTNALVCCCPKWFQPMESAVKRSLECAMSLVKTLCIIHQSGCQHICGKKYDMINQWI